MCGKVVYMYIKKSSNSMNQQDKVGLCDLSVIAY